MAAYRMGESIKPRFNRPPSLLKSPCISTFIHKSTRIDMGGQEDNELYSIASRQTEWGLLLEQLLPSAYPPGSPTEQNSPTRYAPYALTLCTGSSQESGLYREYVETPEKPQIEDGEDLGPLGRHNKGYRGDMGQGIMSKLGIPLKQDKPRTSSRQSGQISVRIPTGERNTLGPLRPQKVADKKSRTIQTRYGRTIKPPDRYGFS